MTPASITVASPIGPLALTVDDGYLVGVGFVGHWRAGDPQLPAPLLSGPRDALDPMLIEAADQVEAYFAGRLTEFDLPVRAAGDEFHRDVWSLIADIPYGKTNSYGWIAEQLGGKHLSQAVGAATGSNPVPLVVPCHRVIGSNGSLTGFGGGLDRKRFLLTLEEPEEVRAARLF